MKIRVEFQSNNGGQYYRGTIVGYVTRNDRPYAVILADTARVGKQPEITYEKCHPFLEAEYIDHCKIISVEEN